MGKVIVLWGKAMELRWYDSCPPPWEVQEGMSLDTTARLWPIAERAWRT